MNRTSTPRSSTLARLLLAAAGALALGGGAGLAITACGADDAPQTAPGGASLEREARPIVLGQPAGASVADRALAARDVPPTITPPTPASSERVSVDDVFGAPGAGAPTAPVEPAPEKKPATAAGPATKVAPAPPVVPGREAPTSRLRLVDGRIATHVASREPEGVADAFDLDVGKLWAWVRVANDGLPTQITMIWRRDGEVASTHSLDVGKSSGWRTWSRRTVRKWDAGDWTVEVLDADGVSLGTLEFTVRDAADGDST